MRKAGDVCFSQVFRDGGGKILSALKHGIFKWKFEICNAESILCLLLWWLLYFVKNLVKTKYFKCI